MKIRYIKDYLRGHTNNSMNSDWTEIKAIDYKGNNIALGKVVTASSNPSWGTFDRVTDGVIGNDASVGISSSEKQWVQVDLGAVYNIDYLHIWHYYSNPRRFNDTKVEVSEDGTVWTVIFDSAIDGTYDESSEGRIFTLPYATDLDKLPTTSPLSQVNSQVNNIKNEINNLKTILKDNLIAKSVNCSDNDKLSSLINKVENIELGRKWISGTSKYTTNTQFRNIVISHNSNFTPSLVFIFCEIFGTGSVDCKNLVISNLGNLYVPSSTVTMNVDSSTITFTSPNSSYVKGTLKWYIFE